MIIKVIKPVYDRYNEIIPNQTTTIEVDAIRVTSSTQIKKSPEGEPQYTSVKIIFPAGSNVQSRDKIKWEGRDLSIIDFYSAKDALENEEYIRVFA
ncbi:hypothetical protein LIL_50029 (plasmid) [Leptospira interrogans serovar Linhai str. 56609]|uniref:Phage protein n=1 Tax=Leptospira interrogans serovar Zanoni str. LT2156 TaxID=1001601 RepID=M6HTK3_LEPIR|nr:MULTISPECIES: hypothetical protein [Leptospira]EMM94261.1 hypothetical protein LEP1GSC158_0609 [Leptospira interrogans serovar Zanoni str. LT2156]AJR16695.1 hypothetical protein LIL_50029 [Leptospira interrogans serovar Linhai str. 56609]KGE21815.1 hypothetical protein IQ65_22020 [Leptospira interrogans serovar Lai]ULG86685.1 hypothetical protein FH594_21820 [Leptospira interrogans]ULG86704.1 hypothetical protein FH594_21930 [Leptospira interrogans]